MFDIDGTLAPIVDHASDAHVPECDAPAADRVARRYGLVACVSGRRASEARAMVSIGTINYLGSHGAELLRAGWTEAVLDPASPTGSAASTSSGARTTPPTLRKRRVRLEDKGPIVAFHWRGAPDEDAARGGGRRDRRSAPRRRACAPTGGARCSRSGRPVKIDKGAGIISLLDEAPTSTPRSTWATTRPTSTRSARSARWSRRARWSARCASASTPTRARRRSPPRPTSSSTGPRACASCWRCSAASE